MDRLNGFGVLGVVPSFLPSSRAASGWNWGKFSSRFYFGLQKLYCDSYDCDAQNHAIVWPQRVSEVQINETQKGEEAGTKEAVRVTLDVTKGGGSGPVDIDDVSVVFETKQTHNGKKCRYYAAAEKKHRGIDVRVGEEKQLDEFWRNALHVLS